MAIRPPQRDFPQEVILNILLCLEQRDIVRAQVVCKHWYGYAQVARKEAFLRRWGFQAVLAEPRSPVLYETIPVGCIVRKHQVARGETLPLLALRYGVDASELMRLNNLMSLHLLQHRDVVYVPVRCLDQLQGCSAAFEHNLLLCRDLLVTLPAPSARDEAAGAASSKEDHGSGVAQAPSAKFNRMMVREMQAHIRRLLRERSGMAARRYGRGDGSGAQCVAGTPGGGAPGGLGAAAAGEPRAGEAAPAMVSVDLPSARYYLAEAGGCAQRAARLFVDDATWQGEVEGPEELDEGARLIRLMATSDQVPGGAWASAGASIASREAASKAKAKRRRWLRRLAAVLACGCCFGHMDSRDDGLGRLG